jgi:hypothetical protein
MLCNSTYSRDSTQEKPSPLEVYMATHSGQQQSNQSSAIQAQSQAPKKPTSTRGFAAMDAEKHKRVSAQGGRASQQTQQGARQASKIDQSQTQTSQTQNTMAGNFSDKNKQESSTESASSNRSGSNQSTGLGGPARSFPSEEWDQNQSQQSGVDKDR